MKKFITVMLCTVILFTVADILYYRAGVYIDLNPEKKIETVVKTQDDRILLNRGEGFREFEIKGVDMGSGIAGEWSTDFAVDKDTYMRWFKSI